MFEIKIEEVWGVGRQLTKFYIKNGINTAYHLKNTKINLLMRLSKVQNRGFNYKLKI